LKVSDFPKLNEIFYSKPENIIYFFDELQNVKDWERLYPGFNDKRKKVVITGFDASMLSRELGTKKLRSCGGICYFYNERYFFFNNVS